MYEKRGIFDGFFNIMGRAIGFDDSEFDEKNFTWIIIGMVFGLIMIALIYEVLRHKNKIELPEK